MIRPFALVMFFGVFTGTFCSIYVASPILLWIETKYPRENTAKSAVKSAARPSPAAPAVAKQAPAKGKASKAGAAKRA